ncbi:MAG: cation transporter [Promethearchaeota archaeon]
MNIFLSASKFIVGVLSGSIGLMADGIYSASGIVASIALFLGIKLSNRKTKTFSHGIYKLDLLINAEDFR